MNDPIDFLADRISRAIKQANPEQTAPIDVMSYALSLLINMFLTTGLILMIGFVTGHWLETCIVLVIFAVLRWSLKGFHLKSMTLCVLVSTALITLCVHLSLPLWLNLPVAAGYIVLIGLKAEGMMIMKILVSIGIGVAAMTDQTLILSGCLAHGLTLIPVQGGERSEKNYR